MGWCSMIKAVIFDIGQTLAYYPIPLNWSSKYRPAFEQIATYSDVAYGMDNVYALEDISPLLKYIDLPYTSNDTGFRKPSAEGVAMIAAALGVAPSEILFVGDEIKDMQCAAVSGATGILINRTTETKDYGQDHEIRSLTEVLNFL